MAAVSGSRARIIVDGKFFRLRGKKFFIKGVTYGPFGPDAAGESYPSIAQARRDFELIRNLGANLLRVYHVPPRWLLDLADEFELKLLVDIPWAKRRCFLDSEANRDEVRLWVRQAAEACADHPAVFALSVVNEVPPDIVRWSGARAMADFIDELVRIVKSVSPDCLCTFSNFPPTEFLRPQTLDFVCFNVYLHHKRPFENYVARLQMIADSKPLILGEIGIDSLREGEARKCEILSWKLEASFRSGLAGAVVYSFTDDWFTDGEQIEDWEFGLTTRERTPKPSFEAVQRLYSVAPYFPLSRYPLVSVVVASFNGSRTLSACLESLKQLNYPAYEVILVDDGSTDETPQIAGQFPQVRYIRHKTNLGLSTARNTGVQAARGEIIAFTDSDCRADEDWLYYLIGDLLSSGFAGIGGHNLLPPEDSWVAAAVMVSPGGPAHVMLTDRVAEHIPGCNMAFYKWAIDEIGGFDPLFRKAGDDVDVCWRLQQRGYRLGFSPGGFVWHYRRSTVRDYLKQQHGYGEAEALLVHRHPEYFNWFGGSQWQGRIYSPAKFGVLIRRPMVYHGTFGSGFFQTLYTAQPSAALMLLTSLEYHVLMTIPFVVLGIVFRFLWPLAVTSLLISLGVCVAAAAQAEFPKGKKHFWSRPIIALLFFLQPIIRGWARYQGRLTARRNPLAGYETLDSLSVREAGQPFRQLNYWSPQGVGRFEFLRTVLGRLDLKQWQNKADAGWMEYDVEIYGSRWVHLQLTTVSEAKDGHPGLLRCRLRTAWTFLAHISFWTLVGAEVAVIGFLANRFSWIWLLMLTLVAFVSWLEKQKRDLRRLIAVFLDEVAAELKLVKVQPNSSVPAAPSEVPKPQRKPATV